MLGRSVPHFVNPGPDIVAPASGNTYLLSNIAYGHWLDNADSSPLDMNSIFAKEKNSPETLNQEVSIW